MIANPRNRHPASPNKRLIASPSRSVAPVFALPNGVCQNTHRPALQVWIVGFSRRRTRRPATVEPTSMAAKVEPEQPSISTSRERFPACLPFSYGPFVRGQPPLNLRHPSLYGRSQSEGPGLVRRFQRRRSTMPRPNEHARCPLLTIKWLKSLRKLAIFRVKISN